MQKAVALAAEARSRFEHDAGPGPAGEVKIALSLGPYGATLTPGHEFDGFYPPPFGPQAYSPGGRNRNAFTAAEASQESVAIDALTDFHLQRLRVFANDLTTWARVDCIAFEDDPRATRSSKPSRAQ